MIKYSPSGHTRSKCVSSSEKIWRNLVLYHLQINGSSAVNGCRQNESPNSWWKHHNNPQVIHISPVHQLTSCDAFRHLTLNRCFCLKCESSIHNNDSSIDKTIFSLNQERNMPISSSVYKRKQFWTNILVDFDMRGQQ